MVPRSRPGICLTLTVTLLAVTCGVRGQTNNTVNDVDGSIVWGELAPDQPYKTVDYTADDGGLDPYYALAVSFIDSSLPETLPVAEVKDILDGKASIGDKWQDLAKEFVGYALCVVIGILFILIFPIVACCFCCCRCCGNCGGKRIQHQGPNDKCKRIGFSIALTILSLFVITGAACCFVTSDQLHKNLDGLNDSVSDAVDDFTTFVDNIDQQFTRLGDTNFMFLSDVLKDYVDNASPKLSEDIITAISQAVNLDTPLDNLSQLRGQAVTKVTQLENQVDTLQSQADTTKAQLQGISCTGCLNARITFLDNLDLTPLRSEISTFKGEVTTDVFQELKTELNTAIQTEVNDGTQSIDVGPELDKIHEDEIEPMLDEVPKFKTELQDDLDTYQKWVAETVDLIEPYDTYRWYAGLGLASLLALMALMLLLGVFLGIVCGSADDRPTERGGASNCGGICLMASVGLVFIFGALLMLVCTLMYMFGALTERYVCQTIDHLDRLEEYTKSFDLDIDLSNYTFNLKNETIAISINDFMTACKEDKTLYTALGLESVVNTALNQINDYKDTLDDLNNIDFAQAARDVDAVDVTGAIDDLENSENSIIAVKTTVTALKTQVTDEQTLAEAASSGTGSYYVPMISTLTAMEDTCDTLQTTATAIKTAATNLEAQELAQAMNTLNDEVFMETLISNVTSDFIQTIFGFVDSYIADIKLKLENSVAKCTPFYSITNAILGEAVCHGIVDALNGFWLALGWCLFFFMPSLILAVKLAKHFRTMLHEDKYDSTVGSSPPPFYTQSSGAAPKSTLFSPSIGAHN